MKAWSQSCHSFHLLRPSHCPVRPKRATPKAPRQCKYIESTLDNERQNRSKPMRAVYNTPHEAFPLLCLWRTVESLRSSNKSKPKRTVTPYMYIYVCPSSAHRGFRYGYRRYKDNTFTLKTTLFGWQSMILRSDLTLLNINMSKKSTFGDFSR